MTRKLILSLVLLLSIYSYAAALTTSNIAKKCGPSVVLINAFQNSVPKSYGSGVIINKNGYIITSYHVIEGCDSLEVRDNNKEVYNDVKVMDIDPKRDLAILKVKGYNLETVTPGNSRKLETGGKVIAIGNPNGLENSVSEGIISSVRNNYMNTGVTVLQITAPISPGSSGGGVFDENGLLIGIVSSFATSGQNLNFALPIHYAQAVLQDILANVQKYYIRSDQYFLSLKEKNKNLPVPETNIEQAESKIETAPPARTERQYIKHTDTATKVDFYYCPQEWTMEQGEQDEFFDGAYEFTHVNLPINCGLFISKEKLTNIDNVVKEFSTTYYNNIFSEIISIEEETRTIDNKKIVYIKTTGIINNMTDIPFEINSYFYADSAYFLMYYTLATKEASLAYKDIIFSFLDNINFHITDYRIIPLSSTVYTQPISATVKYQGPDERFTISYDMDQWRKSTSVKNENSCLELTHIDGAAFALVIYEKQAMSLNRLRDLAIQNLQTSGEIVNINKEERRTVNGKDILCLEMDAIVNGINATYYSYNYSGEDFTVRLITFTSSTVFKDFQKDCEDLLNGLVIND